MADLLPAIHAVHAIPKNIVLQTIPTGVSYMTNFISAGASLVVGFVLGWYVKGRGWFGVKVDASNVAKETEKAVTDIKTVVHG